jgi:hypothetical protein
MEATRTVKDTLCSTGPEGQPYALDEIIQELAVCRRERILLKETPLKRGFEPKLRSRAPLLPQEAANLGMVFSLRQTARAP